jgi:type VI secretion system secreted protein Hcp
MADDIFLKIGDIKGGSVDAKHAGEIDVLAWSWGMSQSGTTHAGTGSGAGKVSVQDLSVTKYTDAATAPLVLACCSGKHYPEAKLTVRQAGAKPLEFLKITLKEVLVKSLTLGEPDSQSRVTENLTLNFAEFKLEYTPQKADGSAGAAITAGWNIAKNSKV